MEVIDLKRSLIDDINNLPISMLEELNSIIKNFKEKKRKKDPFYIYMGSEQFRLDKQILQQTYQDIISGKAKLTSYDEGMDEIDKMINEIENANSQR